MKRREFLSGAVVAGATTGAASLAAPSIVRAQETMEWKMVTTWPKNAPGVGVNAQRFADMVTAMSGGRLTIRLFAAGELVPPFECLDAVQADTAQLAHSTPYYWVGKSPALNFFTTMPFGLTAWELNAWIYFGGGQALWEEVYAPFNVVPFYAGNSGVQSGGWFNREINTLDDLKGLKMRIAGIGGEVMRRLGVAVVVTPAGEIQPALMSGAVDAAEWVGPWLDIAFGMHKAAKYYYVPAFHEPGPGLEVIVNKDRLAALPDDLKAIVKYAARAASETTLADFTFNNIKVFADMREKFPEVELRTFPDAVIAAMGEKTKEVAAEIAERDEVTHKVYEAFMAFNQQAEAYQAYFDLPALRMRQQVFGG
ncbi:TRAP transporter substrate-binding protein [Roseospira marina]|uniref:TRAP transporter substrate-binding protein n=1 Tax=Roseospira marina TaxID=140057 RepID=A0A5M6IAG0_9PROT|nr:TRAP transporter substrate-binding protein [Roseospira marina]KAA5604927.1 TRAP transporter substrate-binding protein [Roseospira marina]MBB4315271.1 TRAP-type mannitol/chloroaromatic compound transport system substrate-binding protein [Roseospira marina]MBB5088271.1 TRAP-type mannitol/chloroaromatic compound transport system substrate-binding protein [Roseospira marina]